MPIYEYHCTECDTTFEKRRTFGQADDPISCLRCESPQVERLLSSFMFSVNRGNGAPSADSAQAAGCACGGACSCAA